MANLGSSIGTFVAGADIIKTCSDKTAASIAFLQEIVDNRLEYFRLFYGCRCAESGITAMEASGKPSGNL